MIDPNTGVAIATAAGDGGVSVIILILIVVIIPFIVKFWNWSKETSAQGMLYAQLSGMVQNQRAELDKLYEQRKLDQDQIFELKHKVERLEEADATVGLLKKRLDQKDQVIAARDVKITQLLEELIQMKQRVHNLEVRLKEDEVKFCEGCVFKNHVAQILSQGMVKDE